MKNAFSRMGRTCASIVFGGALIAGAMCAGNINQVSVTLPHEVSVGSVVLPSGHYTMSAFEMGGEQVFVVRGDSGKAVTIPAQNVQNESSPDKSEVVFSKDGNAWHFDKLVIAGDSQSYQFNSVK